MEITGNDIIYTFIIAFAVGLLIGVIWRFFNMLFHK